MLVPRRRFFTTALRALGAYWGFATATSCTSEAVPPALAVRTPLPGASACPGAELELEWVANAPFGLLLEWAPLDTTQWTLLAQLPAPAPSRWRWTLPSAPPRLQLRWREAASGAVLATVGPLNLLPPQLRWLQAPGGQRLLSGQTVVLEWTADCLDTVELAVSLNAGLTWEVLAPALPATGRYPWTVPPRFTERGLLRLRSTTAPTVTAISADFFQITPEFTLDLANFPALQQVGGQVELEIPVLGAIAISRTGPATFVVLQLTCTHLGCQVQAVPDRSEWRCPCHGSRFSARGCALNGPAILPLPLVEHTWDPAAALLRLRANTLPNPHC